MGTASTTKFIKNNAGTLTEEEALTTSSGIADAHRLTALNSSGFLDPTIINAKNTSAGVGDAGKVGLLDAAGKWDITMMPTGIGADTATILTSEVLVAGDLVNIYNNGGTANVRKADASVSGKEAHGFVLAGFGAAVSATVYFEGQNTQLTGMTPGVQFLSGTTPGKTVDTAPTGTGEVVQRVGLATSATSMNFESSNPIVLA